MHGVHRSLGDAPFYLKFNLMSKLLHFICTMNCTLSIKYRDTLNEFRHVVILGKKQLFILLIKLLLEHNCYCHN
jgi:hypothetical protein